MPCDQVRYITTELTVEHQGLLTEALTAEGWQVQVTRELETVFTDRKGRSFRLDRETGKAIVNEEWKQIVTEAKVIYAQAILAIVAERNGFEIEMADEETTDETSGRRVRMGRLVKAY